MYICSRRDMIAVEC